MGSKTGLAALCIAVCLSLSGCKDSHEEKEPGNTMNPKIVTSTDISTAESIFPALKGVEEVEVEELSYGGSSDRTGIPGPTDYLYRGYITLSDEAAEKYMEKYSFEEAEAEVPFKKINERPGHWMYSREFCMDIMPEGHTGDIWLSGDTLLFDMGTF